MKHTALVLGVWAMAVIPVFAQAPEALAAQLKNGNAQAAAQLAKQGDKATAALIGVLKDGDAKARSHAAWALGEIGPGAKDAIPELLRALTDDDVTIASQAAEALGKIGPAAGDRLVEIVTKGPPPVALHAARALTKIPTKKAAPALLEALRKESSPQNQSILIEAIAAQGAEAAVAAPYLVKLAEVEGVPMIHIIVALGNIGSGAKDAAPFLVSVLKKKEPGPATLHAVNAVGKLGLRNTEITAALLDLMADGQQPRMVLLESLSKAGKVTKESLTTISQGMRDKDTIVRLYTARLVGGLDPNDLSVVSVLMEALNDKAAPTRKLAAEVLLTVQPRDPSVPETLAALAERDLDPAVRQAAAQALAKFKK